jgi:hypothetical protein
MRTGLPLNSVRNLVLAPVVFLTSLALYISTLAPGLLWGGGDFATFHTNSVC